MVRARNNDVHLAVFSRVGTVNITHDDVAHLFENTLTQGFILLYKGLKVLNGVAMIDGFQMLSHAFTTNCNSVFKHSLGFVNSKGVPFYGVGMVGEAYAYVFMQLRNDVGRQRTICVQLDLEGVQSGKGGCIHEDLVRYD